MSSRGLELIETDDGGHYYMHDGRRVPGVSEILAAADTQLSNYFYEERKEAAALRGKDVHLACRDLDRNYADWWSEEKEIAGYVKAYEQFKKDFEFKPALIEMPLYHDVWRYAGTPDRTGAMRGKNGPLICTVDLKCVATVGPHVGLQLAGYNLLSSDWEDRWPFALQLKPNGQYKIHTQKPEEIKQNVQVFLSCLTLLTWRDRFHKKGVYA
jgi:hypothetical protein